jgi:YfiH family protein
MGSDAVEGFFPERVLALTTTRSGGVSHGDWQGFNLAEHVGDDPAAVAANRRELLSALPTGTRIGWLQQEHGTAVVSAERVAGDAADAAVSSTPGVACAVLTADCLPILLADVQGRCVAAVHAGWRGLAAGVLENALQAMNLPPSRVLAWLGPCIGPDAFEVGADVCAAFDAGSDASVAACFRPGERRGHWLADLQALAGLRLGALGVAAVQRDQRCTVAEQAQFYSYRRDGRTGRMASLILIKP